VGCCFICLHRIGTPRHTSVRSDNSTQASRDGSVTTLTISQQIVRVDAWDSAFGQCLDRCRAPCWRDCQARIRSRFPFLSYFLVRLACDGLPPAQRTLVLFVHHGFMLMASRLPVGLQIWLAIEHAEFAPYRISLRHDQLCKGM